jgi:hypothetical protein
MSGRRFFGSRFWEGGTTILMGRFLQKRVDFSDFGGSGGHFGVRGGPGPSGGPFIPFLGLRGVPGGSILGSEGVEFGVRGGHFRVLPGGVDFGVPGPSILGSQIIKMGGQNDEDRWPGSKRILWRFLPERSDLENDNQKSLFIL